MNKFKFLIGLWVTLSIGCNLNAQDSIKINTDNFNSYLEISKQYYKEYRYRQASTLLEKLYQYDTTNIQVTNLLGELYNSFNNRNKATFYLNKSLSRDSLNLFALILSGDLYLRNGDPGTAQSFYFRVLNYVDSSNYYVYRQLANSYYGMGENFYMYALHFFKKATLNNPYDIYSFSRMGNIYNVMNQFLNADSVCNEGLKVDSLNSNLLNIKGYAKYNMKLYLEAAANFELVLQKADSIPFNLKYAGLSYFNMNDYDKARFLLERSVVYDSTDYDPYIVLGQICLQTGDFEKGLSYLQKSERLHYPPPHKTSEIFKTMADIYNQQKEWTKASECFQQAYKLNPKDITLVLKLAYQYDFLNQKEKAVPLYTKVISTADSTVYINEVKVAKDRLQKLQAKKK